MSQRGLRPSDKVKAIWTPRGSTITEDAILKRSEELYVVVRLHRSGDSRPGEVELEGLTGMFTGQQVFGPDLFVTDIIRRED